MNTSQLFAVAALVSAIVDFVLLTGVAWHHRATINASRALKIIYPLCWAIYLIFSWGYWYILAYPSPGDTAARAVLRPSVIVLLNVLLAIAVLATLHNAKIDAQAAELEYERTRSADSERKRLAAEKRWLEERGQFLSVIGHELRTPINLITGYLTLLADLLPLISQDLAHNQEMARNLKTFADGAISGAARLRVMVRMFDATSDQPRIIPLDLCDVVHRAINNEDLYTATRRTAEMVPITVDCQSLFLHGDADMLETAVFELIRNGLKATETGYIQVVVAQAGDIAIVAVEDNGRGILAADVPRIFEPGWQNSESYLRRNNEGSGYGLAMVRHVAHLHGGDVALEWTEPDEGSRFAMYLKMG
jgi:signal transduction histidine kinase